MHQKNNFLSKNQNSLKIIKKMGVNFVSRNLLKTALNFVKIAYAVSNINYYKNQKRKIIFYIFLFPSFSKTWFLLLEKSLLKEVIKKRPQLYIKPFRPYISCNWSKIKIIKVILDTYNFAEKIGSPLKIDKFELANLKINNENSFKVIIDYDDCFRKEGEYVIALYNSNYLLPIASVAFSFEYISFGNYRCYVGAVQGAKKNNENIFKNSQKLLFGLRPTNLVLNCLQEFSKNININSLDGVSNKIQANRKKHFIHLPKFHDISFNYDKFWLELGGKANGDWFEIPIIASRRTYNEIITSKRSLYRNRYAMLDNISVQIERNVHDNIYG